MPQDVKRAFVRSVWGDISSNGIRDGKLGRDIEASKTNQYLKYSDFKVYVFGSDNYASLVENGFDCKMIDSSSSVYDMKTRLYRHKLDALFKAMEDYDEIVFLDWDCYPVASIPDNFWDVMGKKAPFQANLFQYRTKKCLWRNVDWRKVCNGGFLYIRDKSIPRAFICKYNDLSQWAEKKREEREKKGKSLRFREECLMFDDEPAFSKWVDDYTGGWKGMEMYWDLFEPEFCRLKNKSAFSEDLNSKKVKCFVHWGPK